jgi:ABC-2 type transport system ATP-binding protein
MLEAALRVGKAHHGLRIIVLVLIVAAIAVAVVLLQQRRSARRSLHAVLPPLAPEVTIHPESSVTSGGDDQPSTGPRPAEDKPLDETVVTVVPTTRPRPVGTGSGAIVARGLTKHYGDKVAVEDLSIEVKPGHVTGFLGPNGAGKSTTMRIIMGLDAPNAGSVTVNGRHFHELAWPLREVGALLEAKAIHPGRSAYAHLRMLAQTNRIPRQRVDEVLDLVGLTSVSRQLVGNFSLGMGQRLGIAEALLGDPGILLFDEPVNGLDTDGIRWVRGLLRRLAAEGRTVFVSSHLMNEMALTADQVVVIGKGRLIAEMPIEEFTSRNSQRYVRVRAAEIDRLRPALEAAGASTEIAADGSLSVRGLDAEKIGAVSLQESVVLSELSSQSASLEEAFIESTEGDLEYRGDRPPSADNPKGAIA